MICEILGSKSCQGAAGFCSNIWTTFPGPSRLTIALSLALNPQSDQTNTCSEWQKRTPWFESFLKHSSLINLGWYLIQIVQRHLKIVILSFVIWIILFKSWISRVSLRCRQVTQQRLFFAQWRRFARSSMESTALLFNLFLLPPFAAERVKRAFLAPS